MTSIPANPNYPYYPVGYTGGYSWDQASPWISLFESNNRNIQNPNSTASGYWQITNPTWKDFAPGVGVDLSQYPTAQSAPQAVQSQVAEAIYNARGIEPWAEGPNVLKALDSGASAAGSAATSAASQAATDVANAANPNVTPGSAQPSKGWLAGIFDTIASLFGRGSFMILGGGLIILGGLAAIYGDKAGGLKSGGLNAVTKEIK
jgi:hypothetical protein